MPTASEDAGGARSRSAGILLRVGMPVAGLAAGAAALTLGHVWTSGPVVWAPDLLVGVAYFALAGLLWSGSRTGALLALAVGITWDLGSFISLAHYWHRAPLVHLILLAPLYRPRRLPRRAILVATYAVCIFPALWGDDLTAVALGVGLIALAWNPSVRAAGAQRTVLLARWSLTTLALGILISIALTLFVPRQGGVVPGLLLYEAALVAIVILQIFAHRSASTAVLTDLVVDLEETRSDELSAALGRALGDPTVRIGYWDAATSEYRDAGDRPVAPPEPASGSASTEISRDGQKFAIVVHEQSVEGDPRLVTAISAATTLNAANAELEWATRERVAEVEASRRRLVLAGDDELRLLAHQLELTVATPVRRLIARIDDRLPAAGAEAGETFTASRSRLIEVLGIVDATALGLPPAELEDGLSSALEVLASRCPLPVTVDAAAQRFAKDVESALYLCAAEAVTNAVKHASAGAIVIRLVSDANHVTLSVADDGSGLADSTAGTGILGIADRVATVGGSLAVESERGSGTVVTATVPVGARGARSGVRRVALNLR